MALMLGDLDDSMAMDAAALDTTMNVDLGDVDLFGEDIGLDLAPRPPSKQVYQRVDELRGRGGCRSVLLPSTVPNRASGASGRVFANGRTKRIMAWSRMGTIPSVGKDGLSLNSRSLRVGQKKGKWELSEPTKYAMPGDSTPAAPIVHISFCPVGHPELAVVDASG